MKMNQKHSGAKPNSKPLSEMGQKSYDIDLPKPDEGLPFPALPARMVVAIDGWAQSGKNTSGELVAEHLGGGWWTPGAFTAR